MQGVILKRYNSHRRGLNSATQKEGEEEKIWVVVEGIPVDAGLEQQNEGCKVQEASSFL